MLNHFKLLVFSHINLHSIHHNDKAKNRIVTISKFIKIKKLNKYIA